MPKLSESERRELARELLGAKLLKVKDVAEHLGLHPKSVRQACKQRRIPHMLWNKMTGRGQHEYRFSVEQVREIEGLMTVTPEPVE